MVADDWTHQVWVIKKQQDLAYNKRSSTDYGVKKPKHTSRRMHRSRGGEQS